MTNYVCGFYFDHTMSRVVLIWKQKPKWQAGKLNGLGGKIENGELPITAMRREFKEECGIDQAEWHELVAITNEDWRVYFFYALGKVNEFEYAETQEAEEVAKIDVDHLDSYPHISNLRWLIPMAIYKQKNLDENITFFNSVTPLPGSAALNNMNKNFDPGTKAPDELKSDEPAAIPPLESASQDSAEVDSEEGSVEG